MTSKIVNLTFTDEDDIASVSAVEQILNTEVANTLAGDDIIIGTANNYGFENISVLSTNDSNDTIMGIENLDPEFDSSYDLVNSGILNADEDNDILTGTSRDEDFVNSGTLNADENNDILTGTASRNSLRGSRVMLLTIHSIKCLNNGADSFGPDDTYIEVNGRRIWGDYNMKRGQTRSVDISIKRDFPANPKQTQDLYPWIELYDLDNSWSRNDSMGGFNAVLGRERMQQVHGSGSTYEVYYSFDYSYNSYAAVSGGTRDYTSGGTRDYISGGTRDYTSGGTRGGNVLMPIQP